MINTIIKSKTSRLILKLILGGVFIYASLDKIAFPTEFEKIVRGYGILPEFAINPTAIILPWVELLLGVLLIVGLLERESAIGLSFLLFLFIFAIIISSLRGNLKDCGCFGMANNPSENVIYLLLRDVFFLACGILIIISHHLEKKMEQQ